ncbi:ArpU family phage packaging/lysis transcriptional regulator [Atopococcus tabaci]|uniref:ArpU family phage packaging/lysis transcriptional regulator n=1 Tax=Atopococcus tabaci TaxID=269774 RepID=UPI00240A645B|nr:ArpU family phage packaging/lysis transcriptional regulator [Atopococcus tabaci]
MFEINKDQTKENVHKLLSIYRRLELMADAEYSPNVTQSFTAEIKGMGGKPSSAVESEVLKKIDLHNEVDHITKAMHKLNPEKKQILYDKYMSPYELSDKQIFESMHVSKTTFYRKLTRAQLDFAYAYKNGTLLEPKRNPNKT